MIGFIADHPTPKIHLGGGAAYTLNSRDYKGMMIVVYDVFTSEIRSIQEIGTGIESKTEGLQGCNRFSD